MHTQHARTRLYNSQVLLHVPADDCGSTELVDANPMAPPIDLNKVVQLQIVEIHGCCPEGGYNLTAEVGVNGVSPQQLHECQLTCRWQPLAFLSPCMLIMIAKGAPQVRWVLYGFSGTHPVVVPAAGAAS